MKKSFASADAGNIPYFDTTSNKIVNIELTPSDLYCLLLFKARNIEALYKMKQTQIDNGLPKQKSEYTKIIDKDLQEFELLKEKILTALDQQS